MFPGAWQVEIPANPGRPPIVVGQAPFTAIPEDAPVRNGRIFAGRHARTGPVGSAALFGLEQTVGLVSKLIWPGVSCKVPSGRPTWLLSNGCNPKLFWPIPLKILFRAVV